MKDDRHDENTITDETATSLNRRFLETYGVSKFCMNPFDLDKRGEAALSEKRNKSAYTKISRQMVSLRLQDIIGHNQEYNRINIF